MYPLTSNLTVRLVHVACLLGPLVSSAKPVRQACLPGLWSRVGILILPRLGSRHFCSML